MKNLLMLLYFGALLFALEACNKTDATTNVNTAQVALSELSYANVAAQVFDARCIKCHGDAGGINLESFDTVSTNLTLALSEIESGNMPPSGALSADLIALVKAWKEHGAPLEAPAAP